MSQYDIYRAANQRLKPLIDTNPTHDSSRGAVFQARAALRLKAMAAFLEHLGNSDRVVLVIHVAWTSGKGSTATAIAAILRAPPLVDELDPTSFLRRS